MRVFFIFLAAALITSQVAAQEWWQLEYENIDIQTIDKLDATILAARIGSTQNEIDNNLQLKDDVDEFQERRDRRAILEFIEQSAEAAISDRFWFEFEALPIVLSEYNFSRLSFSFCVPRTYNFPDDHGYHSGNQFAFTAISGKTILGWPDEFEGRGCGESDDRYQVWQNGFLGSWGGAGASLELSVIEEIVAENLRNFSDLGKLFLTFSCFPAAKEPSDNLFENTQAFGFGTLEIQGLGFFCHVLKIELNAMDVGPVAEWKWTTENKWENRFFLEREQQISASDLEMGVEQRLSFPQRGSQLRSDVLDAARLFAVDAYGAPVEFVVRDLRVANNLAYVDLAAQRPGGAPINFSQTPAFQRGQIQAGFGIEGDPDSVSGFLMKTSSGWTAVDLVLGASEAWWIGNCSGLETLMPETC